PEKLYREESCFFERSAGRIAAPATAGPSRRGATNVCGYRTESEPAGSLLRRFVRCIYRFEGRFASGGKRRGPGGLPGSVSIDVYRCRSAAGATNFHGPHSIPQTWVDGKPERAAGHASMTGAHERS